MFEIGYLDRVAAAIVRVPYGRMRLESDRPAVLTLQDAGGASVAIPLHRIREVWRDGVIVWERRPVEALQCRDGRDAHD